LRKPDFFIVGAGRSGTTALWRYLSEHPRVFMPRVKEPRFFADDMPGLMNRVAALEDYLALFEDATEEDVAVGEASPQHLYSRTAIRNIREFAPQARLVVMLRNPVEMARSAHAECLYWFVEDEPDFERAWRLQARRRRGERIPPARTQVTVLLWEEMLAAVEKAFAETRHLDVESRFVYPAGSLFDPAEVPAQARRGIWRLLRASGARRAKTQARPEHVTPEILDEFVAGLPGRRLALHLGLESACPWVLRFCVNRGAGPEEFAKAARLSRGPGVRVRANVILGAARPRRARGDRGRRRVRAPGVRGRGGRGRLPARARQAERDHPAIESSLLTWHGPRPFGSACAPHAARRSTAPRTTAPPSALRRRLWRE
jgi:hypothetical protein